MCGINAASCVGRNRRRSGNTGDQRSGRYDRRILSLSSSSLRCAPPTRAPSHKPNCIRCVGPEQRSPLPFDASVVSTGAVYEVLFRGRSTSPQWIEHENASNSGRFILRELRHRNICRQFCQINGILALACIARKRAWSDIKATTSPRLVGTSFAASVDTDRCRTNRF